MALSDIDKFRYQLASLEALVNAKNAAYGGSWRMMRTSTIRDLMACKLERINQMIEGVEDNGESIKDNLQDIAAYALWELVRMDETEG